MIPKAETANGIAELPALTDNPLVQSLSAAVLERHGRQVVLLDLRRLSDATDCFLIATGDSEVPRRSQLARMCPS